MTIEESDDRLDDLSQLPLADIEAAAEDTSNPLHEEAKNVIEDGVRPVKNGIRHSSGGLWTPGLRTGFRVPAPAAEPGPFASARLDLQSNVAAAQEIAAMMAERQAAIEAEDAEEKAQRDADRLETRRQHRVMLGLTIASVALALIATAAAIITLFITGS